MNDSILIAALLAATLTACSNGKGEEATTTSSSQGTPVSTVTTVTTTTVTSTKPTPDQATPVTPTQAPPPAPAATPAGGATQATAPAPAPSPAGSTTPPQPNASAKPAAGSETAPTTTQPPGTAVTAAPAAGAATPAATGGALGLEEGKALAKKSGCFACHSVERKVIGPAWNDVGTKYKGDAGAKENLIKWVHTGGTGRWKDPKTGQEMGVMPPYSPRVPNADIEQLVNFILSLPKQS